MKLSENRLRLEVRKILLREKIRRVGRSMDDVSLSDEVAASVDWGNIVVDNDGTSKMKNPANVKWGDEPDSNSRKSAWLYLKPFIPAGALLTRALATQEDQERIIKNYAADKGYKGAAGDIDAMHKFLTQEKGMEIARKVGRGHGGAQRTGALDLSGADLDKIWASVVFVNKHFSEFIEFAKLKQGRGKSSIIERNNNAVHVHFDIANVKKPFNVEEFKKAVVKVKGSDVASSETTDDSGTTDDGSPGPTQQGAKWEKVGNPITLKNIEYKKIKKTDSGVSTVYLVNKEQGKVLKRKAGVKQGWDLGITDEVTGSELQTILDNYPG